MKVYIWNAAGLQLLKYIIYIVQEYEHIRHMNLRLNDCMATRV